MFNDHIKQDMFLAFQTGGCLLLHESGAENSYNIKMSSFKSSYNIQKKECGPDISVSDNQSSSVTLNELAMKARKIL